MEDDWSRYEDMAGNYPPPLDAPEPQEGGEVLVDWLGGRADHAEAGRLLFGEREGSEILPRPGLLGRLVFSLRHGSWMRLDDLGIWRPEPRAKVRRLTEEHLARVRVRKVTKDGEEWLVLVRSDSYVKGVIASGKDRVTVEAEEWPTPQGVIFADGVAVLPDLRRREVSGRDGATWALPFDAPKGRTPTPEWDAYMRTMWGDQASENRLVVMQWLGATLHGHATRYQRAVLLYGQPGRGKSVLIDTIRACFPWEAITSIEPGAAERFDAAGLGRSAVNLVADLTKQEGWADGWFKTAVCGDPVDIERKNVDRETIRPKAGWLVATNFMPDARPGSGIERRLIILHCDGPSHEEKPDTTLSARIVANELPGIVWAALEAYAAMLQQGKGYTIPEGHAAMIEAARSMDPLVHFLAEVMPASPRDRVPARAAYERYTAECRRSGNKPLAEAKFAIALGQHQIERVKSGSMFYVDRRLVADEPEMGPEQTARANQYSQADLY